MSIAMTVAETVHRIAHDPSTSVPGHAVALGGLLTAWANAATPVLTVVATTFAIIWYAITLYETKTVQDFIARVKAHRAASKKS